MLKQVGKAGLVGRFIARSYIIQHIDRHHRGAVIFVDEDLQAVVQLESFKSYHNSVIFYIPAASSNDNWCIAANVLKFGLL